MDLIYNTDKFQLKDPCGTGQTFKFIRPADPDEVLDAISNEQYEKDHFLPYWAELWPSSQALFNYIFSLQLPARTKVTELGCGLGHISSVLAFRGLNVLSMDISPIACKYAHKNIIQNGGNASVICCDWRFIPIKPQSSDLIIAADILYERRWIEPVLLTIKTILRPKGKVLIADPCRKFWEEFKFQAKKRDFSVSVIHKETVNEEKTIVEILEINR